MSSIFYLFFNQNASKYFYFILVKLATKLNVIYVKSIYVNLIN